MNEDFKKIILLLAAVLLLSGVGIWLLFFRTSAPATTQPSTVTFGAAGEVVVPIPTIGNNTPDTNTPLGTPSTPTQKVFKVASGPVAGSVFIQTQNPTTTVARYIMQDNGHVFDMPIDAPGAAQRLVSNTTIPGLAHALWTKAGTAAVVQYADGDTIKTVSLGVSTSTNIAAVSFLPNNITSYALSPDGTQITYLIPSKTGVVGYVAKANGLNAVKLFTLPLTQVLVSWPSPNTLLVQTKVAAGTPGMAYSVSVKTGTVATLLYTSGLSATANKSFSEVVFQTDTSGTRSTYTHNNKTGTNQELPFNPFPEKCIWAPLATSTLYCAAPIAYPPTNYLDLWHQGLATAEEGIYRFDISYGLTSAAAVPGSKDGGITSDIEQLVVSEDGKYLLFIRRADRSLWAVRLTK